MSKNVVTLNLDGTSYSMRPVGSCSTAAGTQSKAVVCDDFTLATNATILVRFSYANTVSSPTLNVNSTGAKTIKFPDQTQAASYYWKAGECVEFMYDGTNWVMLNSDRKEPSNDVLYTDPSSMYDDITIDGILDGVLLKSAQELTLAEQQLVLSNLGVTATPTELNYCDGVTSNIQTQLNSKSTSDTKNTAGAGNTSSAIYLIGATSQGTNPTTYSHDTVFVNTDGCLYSGGAKSSNVYIQRRYKTLTYYADSFTATGANRYICQPIQYDFQNDVSRHTVNYKRLTTGFEDSFAAVAPINIIELVKYNDPTIEIYLGQFSVAESDAGATSNPDPQNQITISKVNPSRKITIYIDSVSAGSLFGIDFVLSSVQTSVGVEVSYVHNKLVNLRGETLVESDCYEQNGNTFKVEIDVLYEVMDNAYYIYSTQYLME